MKTESSAWSLLHERAAQCLRPGLADRVLRATRQRAEAFPSLLSQFVVGAMTAAACFGAVAFLAQHQTASAATPTVQSGWQEIASATSADPDLGP
ncbi:MAG TPA: hypothetical protein VFE31_07170 [Opitutaceae bacterium]|jgi:hypothetical protein|nr:hypothetical protein [Opitutaceae bacterium]